MSKAIDSLVQASIDSKNYSGVMLARFHFERSEGPYRLANTYQSIYWDEGTPAGEVEYQGAGGLVSISMLPETNELGAQNAQFQLSGISSEYLTDIFSDNYIGKPVYVWYATLDPDTLAVESDSPVLIYTGLMDYGQIEYGKIATITINTTSRLADWERARGGRYNHAYQIRHVDPTDRGFEYVAALQNAIISWGGHTPDDPGSYNDDPIPPGR